MPKQRYRLSDMEYDEISLVDKGANQDSLVTIAKRATEEENMPDLFFEDGSLVNQEALTEGDVVYDGDGNAYEYTTEVEETEKEPELVGKSAFFEEKTKKEPVGKAATKTFGTELREELSKAFTDNDRDAVITKAFAQIDKMQEMIEKQAEIAKSERDLRLTREYISKADSYNLPVDSNELGPVLYRMAETMSYEDCAVIAKCLEATGEMLFTEVGYQGGGDNQDVMSAVERHAVEIGKSADADTITGIFDQNPTAYDEYLASQRGL